MIASARYYLVSLGCPKNLVDSEGMSVLLERAGFAASETPEDADWLVVNTCGFIDSARQEAVSVLGELGQAKRSDQTLIAAGCYPQRSPEDLLEAVPAIDAVIGTRRWMDIVRLIRRLEQSRGSPAPASPIHYVPDVPDVVHHEDAVRRVAIQGASAYLKLADGCRRACGFCAIPLIKGPAVSRQPEAILSDAEWLASQGIQEIILVAQDITDYGRDLSEPVDLVELIDRLVVVAADTPWIRLLYAYPGPVMDPLIDAMARHPQVLPYLDLPLQHAHPDVLRRMRRPADVDRVRRMIGRLRSLMPEVALRTTFLVGFPGETEGEFETLVDFVTEMAFDRVGVFTYSHEEGTPSASLPDDLPDGLKEERRQRLMEIQQPISLDKNQQLVGSTLDVLVEGVGDGLSVGRSYRDAPEIDGLVLAEETLPVGQIVRVRITAALEYDLFGVPA
jgi:ribosomal protein S12 methylthiotransferase